MAARTRIIAGGLALVAAFGLASCDGLDMGGPGAMNGFQGNYFAARTALEKGNYAAAAGRYASMLDGAGPLESRLRLEMAHALLRADRYAEASSQAQIVATMHQDSRRAAALAVLGTAEHRLAQDAMSRGDFGPETLTHLRRADAAFGEMLAKAPDLDPLGGLAQRHQMVKASLANLGG